MEQPILDNIVKSLKRARQKALYKGLPVVEAEYDVDTGEMYLVKVEMYKEHLKTVPQELSNYEMMEFFFEEES